MTAFIGWSTGKVIATFFDADWSSGGPNTGLHGYICSLVFPTTLHQGSCYYPPGRNSIRSLEYVTVGFSHVEV